MEPEMYRIMNEFGCRVEICTRLDRCIAHGRCMDSNTCECGTDRIEIDALTETWVCPDCDGLEDERPAC